MSVSFNLIDEPWLPCLHPDGRTVELGLRDALLSSHQLTGFHGESPLVVAALFRVVLAVLHRVVDGPRSLEDWVTLWRAGALDSDMLDAYLSRWHDRFDLFHAERPFYQWKGEGARDKSVMDLLPEIASGNNATLFDHHTQDADVAFTPAQAARALLFVQLCSVAGGSGLAPKQSRDAPWGRGAIFLVEGKNLFETLMLNLLPYRDMERHAIVNRADDRPVWEADSPLLPAREYPFGWLDYLTWPTRSIWFHPETEAGRILVRRVSMAPGLHLSERLLDPFHHYRMDDRRGLRPYRLSENRAVWRDSSTVLALRTPDRSYPPETLFWLEKLVEEGVIAPHRRYRYMVLGSVTKPGQARFDMYRWEHLPVPMAYLKDQDLVERLGVSLQVAESTRSVLARALHRTATLWISPSADEPDGRRPAPEDVNNLLAHWAFDRAYWGALEIPFFELLAQLPYEPDEAQKRWNRVVVQTARQVFDQVETGLGHSARALRAAVRGRGQLEGNLKKLL